MSYYGMRTYTCKDEANRGLSCDRRIPPKVKGMIHKMVIQPAMLYATETLPLTTQQVRDYASGRNKRCADHEIGL